MDKLKNADWKFIAHVAIAVLTAVALVATQAAAFITQASNFLVK